MVLLPDVGARRMFLFGGSPSRGRSGTHQQTPPQQAHAPRLWLGVNATPISVGPPMRGSGRTRAEVALQDAADRDPRFAAAMVGMPDERAGELQDPARNRDGNPVHGHLSHERVDLFPADTRATGRPAARRRTSFSCSSSLIRPGVDVRPTHPLPRRYRVNAEVGGRLLDSHARAAVPRDPYDILAELFRIRLGHPSHPPYRASQFRIHPIVHQTRRALWL